MNDEHDKLVEDICYCYWKNYHKITKNIYIKRFKNFDKQKNDVKKWTYFEQFAILTYKHNINYNVYIEMISKQYNNPYQFQPSALINIGNLQKWGHYQNNISLRKEHEKVVEKFTNSIKHIVDYCIKNDIENLNEYMRYVLSNGIFDIHFASGKLSKYFLCYIPKLYKFKPYMDVDIAYQLEKTVCKHQEALIEITNHAFKNIKGLPVNSIRKLVDSNIKRKKNFKNKT